MYRKYTQLLIIGLYISNFDNFNLHSLFAFAKLLELVFIFEITKQFLEINSIKALKIFIPLFLFCAYLQGILAILQFYLSSSIGLHVVGEALLSPDILGVAKIAAHGTTSIRGYGTFPHPNLLSSYLVTGLLLSFVSYFLINKRFLKNLVLIGLPLLIFSLSLTFSRAAGLALTSGLLVFIVIALYKIKHKIALNKPIIAILLGLTLSVLVLKPYISSRANFSEQTNSNRSIYNKIGLNMVKSDSLSGLGFGESMIHMQQFSKQILEPWEIQPVHNYFLLATTEGGLIFGAFLLFVILITFFKLARCTWNTDISNNPEIFYIRLTLLSVLLSFLILMQFDHYFYTLQQTQFLLWIVIGASVWQINKKELA
jgi:O-antigen ligase